MIIGNFRDSTATSSTYTGWYSTPARSFAAYYIDDVSLMQCETSSVLLEETNSQNINVYPNPTTGHLFIKSLTEDILKVELYDSMGGKIFQEISIEGATAALNLSEKPNDIYFLSVFTSSSQYFLKLIKI